MNHRVALAVSALSAVLGFNGSAHAQVGVNPVESDAQANTAMGSSALRAQLNSGNGNNTNSTAAGDSAMLYTVGSQTSAFGAYALAGISGSSTVGDTAFGAYSMYAITSGKYNTAVGEDALEFLLAGNQNTAVGDDAMRGEFTTDGSDNTAIGYVALSLNNGNQNTAFGSGASGENGSGNYNVAAGYNALENNLNGSYNTAIGFEAGANVSGSNNIDIGNQGGAEDNGIIRIGTAGTQIAIFIAGVSTSTITGAAVHVTSDGQLGVLASSERYKTSIVSMESTSAKMRRLRPVTFHLKSEPGGEPQYGLIAEEVDRIYPDLVIRDAAGNIDGIRYDELDPLLLNEVQRQRAEVERRKLTLADMQQRLADLRKSSQAVQAGLQELRDESGLPGGR